MVEVRGAFDDVSIYSSVPIPFTLAGDSHVVAIDGYPLSECADPRPRGGGQQQPHP